MPQATDSQIAMWRAAIALAWASGKLNEGEKQKLLEYFQDNLYLSDAQRKMLKQDLSKPLKLEEVWGSITSPEDRAHLLDIAPGIFHAGGDYTQDERKLYDKMLADQMATIDVKKVQQEVHEIAAQIPEEMKKEDQEYESDLREAGPIIGTAAVMIHRFDEMLDSESDKIFGID